MRALIACLLIASPAWADCPAPPDHSDDLDALIAEARAAETEAEGQRISNEMWRHWADAPDEAAQALLDRGMAARRVYDLLAAHEAFDRLVAYCPDYAEGYNQRAFIAFLQQDYAAALPDLEAALEINPRHVAALSGKALTLFGLGRTEAARETLRAALALNPWLSERHLLDAAPGTPL
ncbi:lipoprotein NlpI [Roseivivax jejudonensis]|uniref:Lipoprotein NlpI n=1 Tax=Roseivivax jejudonensis TaxID=1529041 RepID=A0A1X6ZEM5_9RHOB|nr:tetratricopeptide repeat protein [Roseivivax jejudonensis]SLN49093.1 lipoprotein NlpI [Roseivivax jejudonensis]